MRRQLERLLPQLDAATLGAIYISQYPRDVTGIMPTLPFPVVYAYCYTNDGAASVNTDDQQGAYIATQHLLSLGKRRIAMLSGPINSIPMTKRFSGYQRALIDAGMAVDLRLVKTGDWDIGHSCDIAAELLRLDPAPDGIFCQSDHIALGVCRAIAGAGLRIPPGYRRRGLRQLRLRRLRLPHPDHDRPAPGTDREYSLSSIEKRDREAKCRGKKPASRCPAGPPTVRIDHTR